MEQKDIITLTGIINQTTSEINFGTQLKLLASNDKGDEIDVGLYPLCRFVADKVNSIQFEIYGGDKIIRFPIEELEKATIEAKKWVNQKIHLITLMNNKVKKNDKKFSLELLE